MMEGDTAVEVVAAIYVSPYYLGVTTPRAGGLESDARPIDLIPLCDKRRAKLRMGKADPARVSAPKPEWVYMSQQWKIELDQRELREHGIAVPIGNRAFEVIGVLVQSADKLVSKDGLMGRVLGAICRGEPLVHLRLTTINLNLFGSPTRPDYCFVVRSGRSMEKVRQFWNSQSQFGPEMRWASGEGITSGRLNEYRRSAA